MSDKMVAKSQYNLSAGVGLALTSHDDQVKRIVVSRRDTVGDGASIVTQSFFLTWSTLAMGIRS